jgi:small redox-active disulfide protein 2
MEIKVIGPGCNNCKNLLKATQAADKELGSNAEIIYVTEMADIVALGIMRTPGLMINGKIKVMGRVPSVKEIKQLISEDS